MPYVTLRNKKSGALRRAHFLYLGISLAMFTPNSEAGNPLKVGYPSQWGSLIPSASAHDICRRGADESV